MFVKGKSGNPAGKPRGATNKFKIDVAAICKKHDVDPAEAIVLLLKESEDPEFRLRCASELLPYVSAKLRSVEISAAEGQKFQFNIIYGDKHNDR